MDAPELPVTTQAALLGLNRTGLYYRHVPPSEQDLMVKAYIYKIYTAHPFYGYRRIGKVLNTDYGFEINHKTVLPDPGSAWIIGDELTTISLSKGCGGASSMRMSTLTNMRHYVMPA